MCEWGGGRRRYGRECATKKRTPHKDVGNNTRNNTGFTYLSYMLHLWFSLEITQHVARSYMEPIKYVAHFKETPSLSASQQEPKGEFSLNCPC